MKLLNLLKISVLTLMMPIIAFSSFTPVFADNDGCDAGLPPAVQQANGCNNNSNKQDISTIIQNVLNSIILISGTIAVIFVLIGGIKYMTSTGDVNKVESAKKTILYACIGLIICALSFAIVNFVISIINNAQ